MSILSVRDRVSAILNEAAEDNYVTLYAAGLVPVDWVPELNSRSRLAPYWYLDQKKAMSFNRHQIWPEDPGTASAFIIAKTLKTNVIKPDSTGKVYLRKHSVILVQMTVDGTSRRADLQGKQMTYVKKVKPPVDIDAIAPVDDDGLGI